MRRFECIQSTVLPLGRDDVDTDQIIPARFLRTTTREGLGHALFHDWRFDDTGNSIGSIFDAPRFAGSSVLLAGENFGCGSSREHAVWALEQFGIRVVMAGSFADIFQANAVENGLLPLVVEEGRRLELTERLREEPATRVEIDLERQGWRAEKQAWTSFPLESFAHRRLSEGRDTLEFLLAEEARVREFEDRHDRVDPAPVSVDAAQPEPAR